MFSETVHYPESFAVKGIVKLGPMTLYPVFRPCTGTKPRTEERKGPKGVNRKKKKKNRNNRKMEVPSEREEEEGSYWIVGGSPGSTSRKDRIRL